MGNNRDVDHDLFVVVKMKSRKNVSKSYHITTTHLLRNVLVLTSSVTVCGSSKQRWRRSCTRSRWATRKIKHPRWQVGLAILDLLLQGEGVLVKGSVVDIKE
jgi:hypothetical protein